MASSFHPRRCTRIAAALLSTFLCACAVPPLRADVLSSAAQDAREGKADAAIAALQSAPVTLASARLLCALYSSIDDTDDAVRACESAASLAPNSSSDELNLARAYGARAGSGSMLTGLSLVGRIRHAFERAVELDPHNVEALSDLGEFYVEAPSIAGGGVTRARALMPRLAALSPARGHRLAGMIALTEKDYGTAQREFSQELATSGAPEAYVDLARFYKRQQLWAEAANQARIAIERDPRHAADTLDAAGILVSLGRDLPTAVTGLRQYLSSPQTSTAVPLAKAHTLLGQAYLAMGNATAAHEQFEQALSLAHEYTPARKGAHA